MLNIRHALKTTQRIIQNALFLFSKYTVKQVRADYLYIIEDRHQQLQYMREIQSDTGKRGIVVKIDEQFETYVAMYQQIPHHEQDSFHVKLHNIPWQKSVETLANDILKKSNLGVYDVNMVNNSTRNVETVASNRSNQRRKLLSLSPVLDICYDLNYGGMYNFSGCLGSKKTDVIGNIFKTFSEYENHVSLYYNPTSFSQTEGVVEKSSSWGFNNNIKKKQYQTDIGVYMLALKTIHLAQTLSKKNVNVVLGFDNFKNVLQAQWHLLQLLSSLRTRKSTDFINYNAPKILPVSLLNEIYSSCIDKKRMKGSKGDGSFSAILVTQNSTKDELMPEITPFTNNLKHLHSLAQTIAFPLTIKQNPNAKINITAEDKQKSGQFYQKFIRKYINEYLNQKKQTELKRNLYKSDMVDAPWDYYVIYDTQWVLQGLQNVKLLSQSEQIQFLKWITFNIELELIPHWKIKCKQGFNIFKDFLSQGQTQISKQSLQEFVSHSKLQGYFSPFAQDYLK